MAARGGGVRAAARVRVGEARGRRQEVGSEGERSREGGGQSAAVWAAQLRRGKRREDGGEAGASFT